MGSSIVVEVARGIVNQHFMIAIESDSRVGKASLT